MVADNPNVSNVLREFFEDNEPIPIEEDLTDERIIDIVRKQALGQYDDTSSSEDECIEIPQVFFPEAKASINMLIRFFKQPGSESFSTPSNIQNLEAMLIRTYQASIAWLRQGNLDSFCKIA